MIPAEIGRLQELHEKMLDWICEHIKEDEDLFHALYNRIGFAQSELDPEIECRIYKQYLCLPARERLPLKIKAEYAAFQAQWRTLSPDQLVAQADKIALVNRLKDDLMDAVTDEQAEYFVLFEEPLEAISDTILQNDFSNERKLIDLTIEKMYDDCDGGTFYEMEEEYYDFGEDERYEQQM